MDQQQGYQDPGEEVSQYAKVGNTKQLIAETLAGKAWLAKYLHPPSPASPDFNGLPDSINASTVCFHYIISDTQEIASFPVGTIGIITFMPPSLCYQRFSYYIGVGNVILGQVTADNKQFAQVNQLTFPSTVGEWRMVSRSTTIKMDSTDFNNNTYFYGSKFRPTIQRFVDDAVLLSGAPGNLSHAHFVAKYAKHVGFAEVCAALSANADPDFEILSIQSKNRTNKPIHADWIGNSIQVANIGIVPSTGGAVLAIGGDRARTVPAKEGAYFVHDFSEATVPYIPMSPHTDKIPGVCGASTFFSCVETFDPNTQLYGIQLIGSSVLPVGSKDFSWASMDWAVMYHNVAQGGIPTVSAAPLLYTTYYTIQVIPVIGSILQPIAKEAPLYDPTAWITAMKAKHAFPFMLPARFNFWGTFLSIAAAVLPVIVDSISTAVKKKKEKAATATKTTTTVSTSSPTTSKMAAARAKAQVFANTTRTSALKAKKQARLSGKTAKTTTVVRKNG